MLVMIRVLTALLLCSAVLPAQTIIRLGTMVPKGSPWHNILLNMGEEWKKASGGKIELKIYPGGEQGDEPEMVQKVRIHGLQAIAISGAGLSGIDAAVSALQIPMMLDSWEELDYVREEAGTHRYNVGTDTPKLCATSCGGVRLANSFLAA